MKCWNCDKQLPDFPEDAVEQDQLDEVIGHKINVQDPENPYTVSKKQWYCSPDCFIEQKSSDSNE